MHLVRCSPPQDTLDDAPITALVGQPAEGEQWAGFWSSDLYVLRCTTSDGAIEWFSVVDDEGAASSPEARVIPLRTRTSFQSRVSVVVAQSPDGRRMLVGGSVRRGAR